MAREAAAADEAAAAEAQAAALSAALQRDEVRRSATSAINAAEAARLAAEPARA